MTDDGRAERRGDPADVIHRAEHPLPLSSAQKRHLSAASHGLMTSEIGVVLGTSEETVKSHLAEARRKLRAKNTTHAVALAIRKGLL